MSDKMLSSIIYCIITSMVSLVALTLCVLHFVVYMKHPTLTGLCLSCIGMVYAVISIKSSGWGMTALAVKGAEGDWFAETKKNYWNRQAKFCMYSWFVLVVEMCAYLFY